MTAKQAPIFPPQTFSNNGVKPEQLWFDTADAATLIGRSKKWLEALREGRKGIEGPPFVKLGHDKTAPIMYNAAKLLDWVMSFGEYTNVHQIPDSPYANIASFMADATPSDLWLFALSDAGEQIDFFAAARTGMFEMPPPDTPKKSFQLSWLERQEVTSITQPQ